MSLLFLYLRLVCFLHLDVLLRNRTLELDSIEDFILPIDCMPITIQELFLQS